VAGLIAAALLGVSASPADAYREYHRCNDLPKDTRCYTSSEYHSWLNVRASLVQISNYKGITYGLCAKSVNVNNQVRTGSTCADAASVRACLNGDLPLSRAYGSHSGDAFFYNAITSFFHPRGDYEVAAATTSDTVGVCGR
jgi:hypothetical protein